MSAPIVEGVWYAFDGSGALKAPSRPDLPVNVPSTDTGLGRSALGTTPLGGS